MPQRNVKNREHRFLRFPKLPSVDALSRQQSEAVDRLAVHEYGMSVAVLMENAGREIALIAQEFPGSVAVICGPGNNGGDGFVCARHLVNRGRTVRIHLVPSPDAFPSGSVSEMNLLIATKMGIPMAAPLEFDGAQVVVDALFGTGLSRVVSGAYESVIARINQFEGPVIAVDLPSGLAACRSMRLDSTGYGCDQLLGAFSQ